MGDRAATRRWGMPAALLLALSVFGSGLAQAAQAGYLTGPSAGDPLDIAQDYIRGQKGSLGLTDSDLADWVVSDRYVSKHNGVIHIYLLQRHNGIPVFNGLININVTSDGRIINMGNRFVPKLGQSVNTESAVLTAMDAVKRAALDLGLTPPATLQVEKIKGGPAQEVTFGGGAISIDSIPVRLTYLPVSSGDLRLAWDLRIRPNDQHAWQMQVDAVTGEVLKKMDLVVSDSYKVYAWPAESPNHVTAPLPLPPADGRETVTETAANPTASPFGWHDLNGVMGGETVNTTGNNVFAQTDLDMTDVFTPGTDVQPISATRDFVFPVDLTMEPAAYREGVVTNLFYWNNIVHDISYVYGFDEVSGNFQNLNYTAMGLGSDAVQADAQDGSGTDNANFLTLPDGVPPRMQMFVWTAPPSVQVNAPGSIAGVFASAPAAFGAALDATGVTGDLELVNDGTANGQEGCGTLQGFTAGKIALIRRGTCEFGLKVLNAQNAGAIAAIIWNNQGEDVLAMGPGASGGQVTISSVFVAQSTGELFKTTLQTDAVNVTLKKVRPNRDSDLDNAVIIHEYGHGISNRLTGGPQMVTCLGNPEQGGEGWSDWFAMAYTARTGDTAIQRRGMGTYVAFQDPPGFGGGIRAFPYSTDMAVNPQTYDDVRTAVAPHGVGAIWAEMLWEMYWALVDGVPSQGLAGEGYRQNLYDLTPPLAGNQIAIQLVMDGMKLQPCSPTFVDARDAILAADLANYGGAYQCHIWNAFAKRGLGVNAVDGGGTQEVTEDFTLPASCRVGACVTPPTFAGLGQIATGGSVCKLTLQWPGALNNCEDEPITYSIFRDTNPNFTPAPANRIATNLTAQTYEDAEVQEGVEYFYVVRATDHLGNTEGNLVRRSEIPGGPPGPAGPLLDNAGDTGTVAFTRATTPGNTWAIRATGGVASSKVHATTAAGNYANSACMAIETDTLYLGNNPTLSFQTKYDIEPGWDGAIVEVSTASGGFGNWTKLTTINYPGVMGGPLGNPACNNPGFDDGELAFTGTTAGEYLSMSGSLSAYANQAVRIRFLFSSDGATNDLGWFVDNITVDPVREPGSCVFEGTCLLKPAFAGVGAAVPSLAGDCGVVLTWGEGFPQCANSSVRFNIYRSVDPAFIPVPGNAIRLGYLDPDPAPGNTYHDAENLVNGTTYYYIVRAEDSTTNGGGPANGGNEEGNLVQRAVAPTGPLGPAPDFFDDMEPSANPGYSFETPVNTAATPTWTVVADPTAHSPVNSFFSQSSLEVKDDRLISPPWKLTSSSQLIFWHKFFLEDTYDGGVLEVSTDGGSSWVDVVDGGGSFVQNGYNGTIVTNAGSLIAGRQAWTAINDDFENMSGVIVNLGAFASPGRDVRVRWRSVGDPFVPGANPGLGWWVDDIQVTNLEAFATCSTIVPEASGDVLDTLDIIHSVNGEITLTWGTACVNDTDYEIYEGDLGDYYSHSSKFCSTEGLTTKTFTPQASSSYYLVVPRNQLREGSYGQDSTGAERPAAFTGCLKQQITPACQ